LQSRMPRAYIVTIGINTFQDSSWDLNYAANDARQFGSTLEKTLQGLREPSGNLRYEKVVWVSLIADAIKDKDGSRQVLQGTKAQIEAVFKTLAGQPVDSGAFEDIAGINELRRVNPEDTVIIMISTHGMVDKQGTFYFLPANIGSKFYLPGDNDPALKIQMLKNAVSNDELAQWLGGMDAIDQVMVIDACHSAASVQNASFKPGPFGSRGLGQLAYDKGMKILSASQVDQDARETGKGGIKMGLLNYALVKDGLETGKADYLPADGRIMLSEWLNYASQRVPEIFKEIQSEEEEPKGRRGTVIYSADKNTDAAKRSFLQQPSLFDFTKGRDIPISERRNTSHRR